LNGKPLQEFLFPQSVLAGGGALELTWDQSRIKNGALPKQTRIEIQFMAGDSAFCRSIRCRGFG